MNIREGFIPVTLETGSNCNRICVKTISRIEEDDSNKLFGFGLAHVVLGVIDLFEYRRRF